MGRSFLGIASAWAFGLVSLSTAFAQQAQEPAQAALKAVPVSSQAFVFSPGNWTGDAGRGGELFRQTWTSNAYFQFTWESKGKTPSAKILLDDSFPPNYRRPTVAYCIDGAWKLNCGYAAEIPVEELRGAGRHVLRVFLQRSEQVERWGSPGKSGQNVLRVKGVALDSGSEPAASKPAPNWALIVGDSITEGIGTSGLSAYSFLVGEALRTQGYEYCVTACGWSGWLNKGDNPPGDVPAYYFVSGSVNGKGGSYDDSASRWNKIDGNSHSLLDSAGRISGYGGKGQEPSLILINYYTNDVLHKSNVSDVQASMVQCLAALRKSAPDAQIVMLIPFGQFGVKAIKDAVAEHKASVPGSKVDVIDLGPEIARSIAGKNSPMGGLHPSDRGHAYFASLIVPQLISILNSPK